MLFKWTSSAPFSGLARASSRTSLVVGERLLRLAELVEDSRQIAEEASLTAQVSSLVGQIGRLDLEVEAFADVAGLSLQEAQVFKVFGLEIVVASLLREPESFPVGGSSLRRPAGPPEGAPQIGQRIGVEEPADRPAPEPGRLPVALDRRLQVALGGVGEPEGEEGFGDLGGLVEALPERESRFQGPGASGGVRRPGLQQAPPGRRHRLRAFQVLAPRDPRPLGLKHVALRSGLAGEDLELKRAAGCHHGGEILERGRPPAGQAVGQGHGIPVWVEQPQGQVGPVLLDPDAQELPGLHLHLVGLGLSRTDRPFRSPAIQGKGKGHGGRAVLPAEEQGEQQEEQPGRRRVSEERSKAHPVFNLLAEAPPILPSPA